MNNNAYDEGFDAMMGGGSESDNPYPKDSEEWNDWYDGFTSLDDE